MQDLRIDQILEIPRDQRVFPAAGKVESEGTPPEILSFSLCAPCSDFRETFLEARDPKATHN